MCAEFVYRVYESLSVRKVEVLRLEKKNRVVNVDKSADEREQEHVRGERVFCVFKNLSDNRSRVLDGFVVEM